MQVFFFFMQLMDQVIVTYYHFISYQIISLDISLLIATFHLIIQLYVIQFKFMASDFIHFARY